MSHAMTTEYLEETSLQHARIRVSSLAGAATLTYDDDRTDEDNHRRAAEMLAEHYGWLPCRFGYSETHRLDSGPVRGGFVWVVTPLPYNKEEEVTA